MSIVEYVVYDVDPSRAEEFTRDFAAAAALIDKAAACRSIEYRQGVEDPRTVIARVVWDSIDGHMAFRDGPTFGELKAHLADWTIRSIGHYELLDFGDLA